MDGAGLRLTSAFKIVVREFALAMFLAISEFTLEHVVLSIDADPVPMLLIVHPVSVVLTVCCDLLAHSFPLALEPKAIVYVMVALPIRAEGALSMPHVVQELAVVCHLRGLLVIEARGISFALLQSTSVYVPCFIVDAHLHCFLSRILRGEGSQQRRVMVVDPVSEVVRLRPKSNKLHIVSIVMIEDFLQHFITIFRCLLQLCPRWIGFLATLFAKFLHKSLVEHLQVAALLQFVRFAKHLGDFLLLLVDNFELLLLLLFLILNGFTLLVQAVTVKQFFRGDGILFPCLRLEESVVDMDGLLNGNRQVQW